MSENEKPLELLKLLNLDGSDPVNERLLRWEEAFEAWMEERQTQVTPTTAESSHIAWREFLAVTGKPPWEATAADVEAYIQALQKRKLRPATVKNRLGRRVRPPGAGNRAPVRAGRPARRGAPAGPDRRQPARPQPAPLGAR
jgi:hypothetical protein